MGYQDKLKATTTAPSYAAKLKPIAAPTPAPKVGLGQKLLNAGTKVANFVGAKGISEQFGADIARIQAPADQKNLVQYPSMKSVLGSAVQTGANFLPGAGVGASLTRKAVTGAAAGYAMDVGAKLQTDRSLSEAAKPGLGTAIGAALPIAGKLTGFGNAATKAKKLANTMEQQNLRMTPVEKQNLARQGKDVANFLASKKIVGSPEQRYARVDAMNDEMENTIQTVIDKAKVHVPKSAIIEQLEEIPGKYIDNLSEYNNVVAKVERIIETLKKNQGDVISAASLNRMKRAEWQNAYAKNNTDVINEVSKEVGTILKDILDKSVKSLQPLNKEYGMLIAAKNQLFKAQSRNQAGIFGRAIGTMTGGGLGSLVGGGTGVGAAAGGAAGAYLGDRAANMAATPIRSVIGAGAQITSEAIKKTRLPGATVQPIRKTILQSLQASRSNTTPSSPQDPKTQSQVIPSPQPTMDPGRVNEDGSITLPGPLSGKEMTIDPMMGGGTIGKLGAKSAVKAADIMKDGLLKMLRQDVAKIDNALQPQLADDASEFMKFLEETPNPTIAQMNKGFEILRRQGKDVSKLSDEIIEATRREYEQARDVLGRYAKGTKR